jgi:hypothetical protein
LRILIRVVKGTGLLLLALGFVQAASAQSPSEILGKDSLASDSNAIRIPFAHVQSVRTVPAIDSLWQDSIWSWQGPCSAPTALIQFKWMAPNDTATKTTLVKEVPCMLEVADVESMGSTYRGELTASSESLYAEAQSSPNLPPCFPPTPPIRMAQIKRTIQESIFESEKVQLAMQISAEECLNKSQTRQLLLWIPSEDRRLALFEQVIDLRHQWTVGEVEDIFQLQFIERKALAVLNNL